MRVERGLNDWRVRHSSECSADGRVQAAEHVLLTSRVPALDAVEYCRDVTIDTNMGGRTCAEKGAGKHLVGSE